MSFQLILNILCDFSFERDRQMDGRVDGRTEPLIEVLWRTEKSSYHITETFPVILASFRDFQLERDRPTNRPTDKASYRGAPENKNETSNSSKCFAVNKTILIVGVVLG